MNQWERNFRARVQRHCDRLNELGLEEPLNPDDMVEALKQRMAEGEWERLTNEN